MPDCEFKSLPAHGRARLCLDYGTDEQICGSQFHLSERGLRFASRWQFSLGTTLAVSCVWRHPRLGALRVMLEGIVVWCEPVDDDDRNKAFDSTVLFLELPDELKQSLREFSFALGTV
jgi:hypothetical protein